MICSRRLYKGNAYEICLPLTDSGVTLVRFYTQGDVIIEKEPEISGDSMCFSFTEEEIAALPDGVLRYSYDDFDTNTEYVIVTPGDYSGTTLDDMLEDAYESGLTSCSGSSCNIQPDKGLNLTELTWEYTGGGGPSPTNYGFYHMQNWMQEVSHDSGYDGMDKFVLYGSFQPKDAYDAAYSGGYDYGFQRGQRQLIDNMGGLSVNNGNLTFHFRETSGDGSPENPYVDASMWYDGYFSGITYSGGSGYSHVDVGVLVTPIYFSGFTSGQTQVLDRIGATAITSNGVYAPLVFTSGDTVGWSSVTVNVPQTGYTQADLDAAFASGKTAGYDSGYTNGYNSGFSVSYASGYTAGYSSGYTDGLDDCGPQPEYSGTPLTFEIVSAGTIVFELGLDGEDVSGTSKYSMNDAAYTSPSSSWTVNVQPGDTLSVIGYVSANTLEEHPAEYVLFENSTALFNLKGNAMSLVAGDSFTAKTDFEGVGMFYGTFYGTGVIDASNLVLPVLDLTSTGNNNGNANCYAWMFEGCSALTHAPQLPATTLVGGCYMGMFDSCKNLLEAPVLPALVLPEAAYLSMFEECEKISQLVCLATDFLTYQDEPATQRWLNGVATPGIFYKNPNTNAWQYNDHDIYANCPFNDYCAGGVPDGWTIVDYEG